MGEREPKPFFPDGREEARTLSPSGGEGRVRGRDAEGEGD